jgi:predicted PurR-regulated permease PerM
MPDTPRRMAIELPWRTVMKVIAGIAIVWLWLKLYQFVLLTIVAAILAVALDPAVTWLQVRGWRRPLASAAVGLTLAVLVMAFFWMTWTTLSAQASVLSARIAIFEEAATSQLPPGLRGIFGLSPDQSFWTTIAPSATTLARNLVRAAAIVAIAFILTVYLMVEGRVTTRWLLAFAPRGQSGKLTATLAESRRVMARYVAANVLTSLFAATFVFVALTLLHVPAALLLAVVAGICDFVPVLGFLIASTPAVLLAMTVSNTTAFIVAGCYIVYHIIENYWIAPQVYGRELKLSNVAVILAFVVGAEIAGVVGAIIALPLAALYPTIERIWLRDRLGDGVVEEHRALEHRRTG